MNILAIETSGQACSVAILKKSDMLEPKFYVKHEVSPLKQAETLLPFIQDILSEANITLKQIDAVAFGCGPGSFTGVRIATSIAQGLGYALNIPLIPISSLAALAQTAFDEYHYPVILVAIDARINEVYWGGYQSQDNNLVVNIVSDQLSKPDLVLPLSDFNWVGVGNAWDIYHEKFVFLPQIIQSNTLPTAKAVAKLAADKFVSNQGVKPNEALPLYLRNEVAKKTQE